MSSVLSWRSAVQPCMPKALRLWARMLPMPRPWEFCKNTSTRASSRPMTVFMPRGRKSSIFCMSAMEKKMRFFVPVEPEE